MQTECVPWGVRLMADRLPEAPPAYARAELDPASQTARFYDAGGFIVDMGKHGTNRTRGTATRSGGGDGKNPQPQRTDDNTTDYESD